MKRLALFALISLLFLCSNAQFSRPSPNMSIPKFNLPNLGDFRAKLFDILRQQQEAEIPTPEDPVPVTEVTYEEPKPQAPKDSSPSPQCLSQTYQALSVLYSFGADSSAQDIAELQADFNSLSSLVQKINNFCVPRVVIEESAPVPIAGDCDDNLNNIAEVMNQFSSGDPTNYLNVIKTVQELGAMQANFTRDCKVTPVKKIALKSEANCENLFIKANEKVSKINEDALSNDVNEIITGFNELKEVLVEVNEHCDERLRINLIPPNRIVFGNCADHFEEMRKLARYDRVSNLEETAANVQRVWDMLHKFLQSC